MTKKNSFTLAVLAFALIVQTPVLSQAGAEKITAAALESHVSFLASPHMRGRMNGERELDIAAEYLASQAKLTGLKPANGKSYFQPFIVISKKADPERSFFTLTSPEGKAEIIKETSYHLIPQGPADLDLDGELVFAGYGIRSESYNDLEGLDLKGKVVIVMERAPLGENGKYLLNDPLFYNNMMSFQMKLGPLLSPGPKAVLFVPDPKSGAMSVSESIPALAGYLASTLTLKGEKENVNPLMNMMPKVLFVNRSVVDAILEGTGKNLEDLQRQIDSSLKPASFLIEGKRLAYTEKVIIEEKTLNNVAAFLEGSHPEFKNEVIVYSAHYDHIGTTGDKVNPGADDDASGCAALLEMADAFSQLKKKPLRSILFLWVAGEEVGLFGSQSYTDNPLFPLDKTVANLNMDMIGRTKQEADSTSETPMTGPNHVFVITGGQSSDLTAIAEEADRKSSLDFDYSLSGRDHPLQLFSRSDHFNFVKKDIPVLFFSTGIHSDYHNSGDVIEKIDFPKMELVTRTMYSIGLELANRKTRIVVDNPYSSWGKKE
jgi:hypothetical protein